MLVQTTSSDTPYPCISILIQRYGANTNIGLGSYIGTVWGWKLEIEIFTCSARVSRPECRVKKGVFWSQFQRKVMVMFKDGWEEKVGALFPLPPPKWDRWKRRWIGLEDRPMRLSDTRGLELGAN